MATKDQIRLYKLLREQLRRKAQNSLIDFVKYVNLDYEVNWHHKFIADKLQAFFESETNNKLMLFVPPQFGKSELASRMLPAYILGKNPNLKIAAASYSIDLARSFNRDIQRIIDGEHYNKVFPKTTLNTSRAVTVGNYLKNSEEFEVINAKGSYKAVGVMGGLSGRKVDIAIIDDPVKDAMEANSKTYRERVWEWYLNVLATRLHNKSKVLLIMTRWHEDDLAGRLLQHQADKWDVISLPAIKENNENVNDPREIGESLWDSRHSLEKLNDLRKMSERTFASLYQQRPAPEEGGMIKKEWFNRYNTSEITSTTHDIVIDGAYTKDTTNDPTVLLSYFIKDNCLYITNVNQEWLEFPELIEKIKQIATQNSKIYVEPKATGLTIVQYLKRHTTLNIISDISPTTDKISRLSAVTPVLEAGRVYLPNNAVWVDNFINEVITFPNATHDDQVDALVMAINKLIKPKKKGIRRR